MKLKLNIFAVVASLFAFGAAAQAQTWSFDADGEGEGQFQFEYSEQETNTDLQGAEYGYNGGAGAEGSAKAKGQITAVGGYNYETAGGNGYAHSSTFGPESASANMESASYGTNGALAADWSFTGDTSKMSHEGVITAGGAGSATTGLTTGTRYDYAVQGSGSYDFDADGQLTVN